MKEFFMDVMNVLRAPSDKEPVRPHEEVEKAAMQLEFEIAALDALVRELERERAARR